MKNVCRFSPGQYLKKKWFLLKAQESKIKKLIVSVLQSPEVAFNLCLKRAGRKKKKKKKIKKAK